MGAFLVPIINYRNYIMIPAGPLRPAFHKGIWAVREGTLSGVKSLHLPGVLTSTSVVLLSCTVALRPHPLPALNTAGRDPGTPSGVQHASVQCPG